MTFVTKFQHASSRICSRKSDILTDMLVGFSFLFRIALKEDREGWLFYQVYGMYPCTLHRHLSSLASEIQDIHLIQFERTRRGRKFGILERDNVQRSASVSQYQLPQCRGGGEIRAVDSKNGTAVGGGSSSLLS